VSQQTSNHSFDDLARALAEGSISRRGALKLFAGTAIAALIPSRALAQQRKVTICHKPGTPDEETKEVPDSAVGSHLRHGDQLGPCCLPNGATCTTGSDCCNGNCQGGMCVESCIPTNAISCDENNPAACGGGARCLCRPDASGGTYCQGLGTSIACTTACDCPAGQFCRLFATGGLCASAC
jgi:hypothetical protein